MQTVTDPEDTALYAPDGEFAPDDHFEDEWYEAEIEEETVAYPTRTRQGQFLRLILLLMLIVAAAAFVVFVLLPALDSLLNPAPLPQLQPPVQV